MNSEIRKVVFLFLFLIVFVINACIPTKTEAVTTSTLTVSPTITYTSTPSITPLPTIPTFTSTFDVSTIVTVTPSQKAECPEEDSSVVAKFATPNSVGFIIYDTSVILDYLNSGGTLVPFRDTRFGEVVDLTGDGSNEIIYSGLTGKNFLGCKDRKYQDLLYFSSSFYATLAEIGDFNENGIPEIFLYDVSRYGFVSVYIYEWDGNEFRSLINAGTDPLTFMLIDGVYATTPHKVMDTNEDGIKEIVLVYDNNQLCDGFGSFCNGAPTREMTTILQWNGKNYVVKREYYTLAKYRFQSVQDGDREGLYQNYELALKHYQSAIFDSSLEWWNEERKDYEVKLFYDSYASITPTPLPYPLEDQSEYPSLASYAYYRIMLIQLVQGQETEANTTYQTLLDTFGNDYYAKPYIEMATSFLEAYQVNQSMYAGCAAAIQYAVEHPELLIPLGSDYHGSQAKIYKPEDVCPFR